MKKIWVSIQDLPVLENVGNLLSYCRLNFLNSCCVYFLYFGILLYLYFSISMLGMHVLQSAKLPTSKICFLIKFTPIHTGGIGRKSYEQPELPWILEPLDSVYLTPSLFSFLHLSLLLCPHSVTQSLCSSCSLPFIFSPSSPQSPLILCSLVTPSLRWTAQE